MNVCIKYTRHKVPLGFTQEAEQFAAQFPFKTLAYMCIFVRNRQVVHQSRLLHTLSTYHKASPASGEEAAALRNPPCYEEGCFAGVVGYCTARDGLTSVKTRIFPHFPAAGSDPVYLLSACCLLLFCPGLGSRFCSGLGKWSFDLQMRKEEGSRSKAEQTGRETACWIMLIKLCSAMENPFYFSVQSIEN